MYNSTPWSTVGSTTMKKPGYIPVNARRSFNTGSSTTTNHIIASPTPTTPPPANAQTKKKTEWPDGVKNYVSRCFVTENLIIGISKEEMEAKLKSVITQAAQSNNLGNVDWAHLPLPQQMIQEERNGYLLGRSAPPRSRSPPSPYVSSPYSKAERPEKSKKRKSGELTQLDKEFARSPPWRQSNQRDGFEDRISFAPAEKRQRFASPSRSNSKYHQTDLEQRKKRFSKPKNGSRPLVVHAPVTAPLGPIVGRCQDLEKNYYRLTEPPEADTVRPLSVLRDTLDLIKQRWSQTKDYAYTNDQFKSLRQDLTVQHIKNDFTVTVYEINARVALERRDLGEYNQCQTQLKALYKQNLGGHPMEFKAYRIFYFIYTCNRIDMNNLLAELTPADKKDPAVAHALQVRSALALGDYHRFFKLYLETPNMGAYMIDNFVVRERLSALASICKAYKPDIGVRFITEELAFNTDEDTCNFLLQYAQAELLCERESDGDARLLTGKTGLVFEEARREAFSVVDLKGQI